jgi:hypothetical protein
VHVLFDRRRGGYQTQYNRDEERKEIYTNGNYLKEEGEEGFIGD